MEFLENFNKADQVMHPVERQWHYPTMRKYGYKCEDPPQKGFVRSYTYTHPMGHVIKLTTGVSTDSWNDLQSRKFGYPDSLESHVKSLSEKE